MFTILLTGEPPAERGDGAASQLWQSHAEDTVEITLWPPLKPFLVSGDYPLHKLNFFLTEV